MEIKIEMRQVADIKPYEKNAKKHPKSQTEQIARSIQEFGFNQPIVLDKQGVIIVGHGRYLAATEVLKMDIVPTITVDITEEQAKAYRLADNKLNESDWDMKLVIAELKDISAPMVDLTGFSSDLIIENSEKDNDAPEAPAVPRSKEGDLYILGNHRVLCGDSTKLEDIEKLMDGRKADMYLSDPPYNVAYNDDSAENLKARRRRQDTLTVMNDSMDDVSFRQFLRDAFAGVDAFLKQGGGILCLACGCGGIQFSRGVS